MNIKFLNTNIWLPYTKNTRSPKVLIERILNKEIKNNQDIIIIKRIKEAFEQGKSLPTMLLLSRYKNRPEVVLDGHHRLSAYVYSILKNKSKKFSLLVYVGISKDFSYWKNF